MDQLLAYVAVGSLLSMAVGALSTAIVVGMRVGRITEQVKGLREDLIVHRDDLKDIMSNGLQRWSKHEERIAATEGAMVSIQASIQSIITRLDAIQPR